jgi:hypothetical protein
MNDRIVKRGGLAGVVWGWKPAGGASAEGQVKEDEYDQSSLYRYENNKICLKNCLKGG